jgi:acyl-CoA hydrolase
VQIGQSVCLEAFVTWTHKTSIEVFVKVVAEDLLSGERNVCATAFLTFVAVDGEGQPQPVPPVLPETELELFLHAGGPARAEARRTRRGLSKQLASRFGAAPIRQSAPSTL